MSPPHLLPALRALSRAGDRRGVALALALLALTTVAFLVAAGFFVAVREQRLGLNSVRLQQSLAAAEAGAADVVNAWDPGVFNPLPPGAVVQLGRTDVPLGAGWYRGVVQRLSETMFLVVSEGFSRDSTARQRIGQVIQLSPISLGIGAALESRGSVGIAGSATVSGADAPPVGWTACPPPRGPRPALRMAGTDSLNTAGPGCSGGSCLTGLPPILRDSTVPSPTTNWYGGLTWGSLMLLATKTIPAGSRMSVGPTMIRGQCLRNDPANWGDPSTPGGVCGDFFPVVSATGDLTIDGGLGQGILLVDGDLTLGGGFRFTGAVVARGRLRVARTGAWLEGGVVASGVELASPQSLGGTRISYSSCGLNRVLKLPARGRALRERGWFQAY